MDYCAQLETRFACDRCEHSSFLFVADSNHYAVDTVSAQPRKLMAAVENRQARPMKRIFGVSAIFKKGNYFVTPVLLYRIEHHPTMTACTPERKLHKRLTFF